MHLDVSITCLAETNAFVYWKLFFFPVREVHPELGLKIINYFSTWKAMARITSQLGSFDVKTELAMVTAPLEFYYVCMWVYFGSPTKLSYFKFLNLIFFFSEQRAPDHFLQKSSSSVFFFLFRNYFLSSPS
eukprot:TRINITY_DN8175_c0_g1_i3.p2 TRINITY_DN8175_c0_g1~~TRINITY_DN8175_c0_g1_i3.p2  ORF type:complete len:131 (+),score=9.61 TRINITY_DN8175_c0_g1_i3:225-617(+)